jgi:hypothetical protein
MNAVGPQREGDGQAAVDGFERGEYFAVFAFADPVRQPHEGALGLFDAFDSGFHALEGLHSALRPPAAAFVTNRFLLLQK